jgi:hypothetical protein
MGFCYQQLDALLEQEDQLQHDCYCKLPEIVTLPPINWSIDALLDEFLNRLIVDVALEDSRCYHC